MLEMIVEGAFFKLPELLVESRTPDQQYESTLVSHFAMAVLLEFQARNIQQPLERMHIERPYPTPPGTKGLARADIFIDLSGLIPELKQREYARYGMKRSNWLEVKLFARLGMKPGNEPKVRNTGSIAMDLLRLCLYLPESTYGGARDNNRYFLCVFDRHPAEYLAFRRQLGNPSSREWLEALFSPGDKRQVRIAFHEEPKSFRSASKAQGMRDAEELTATFMVVTTQFRPVDSRPGQSFYGYLCRIVGFDLRSGNSRLYLEDTIKETWDQDEDELQRSLARRFLNPA